MVSPAVREIPANRNDIPLLTREFPTSCTEVVHICTDDVRFLNVGVLLSRCVCTTSSDNILMIVFAFY